VDDVLGEAIRLLRSTVTQLHPQLMKALNSKRWGISTLRIAVGARMIKGATNSVFPDGCRTSMSSLRIWLGFASSSLKLRAQFGAVFHGCGRLLAVDVPVDGLVGLTVEAGCRSNRCLFLR